jgi:hypothetical protein
MTDIQVLAAYCRTNLDLTSIDLGEEYGYPNLPACIIDTIFSIGARYSSTQQTVNRFLTYINADSEYSVHDLIQLYRLHSIQFLAKEVYKNRQRTSTRNGILKAEAVLRVAEVLFKHGVNYLGDVTKIIHNPVFESDYKQIPGQSSGISLHYFYMLIGVEDEIKPDRMVIRFMEAALNRSIKVEECHALMVGVCKLLSADGPDLKPRYLDHIIWQFQRIQE